MVLLDDLIGMSISVKGDGIVRDVLYSPMKWSHIHIIAVFMEESEHLQQAQEVYLIYGDTPFTSLL